MYILNIAKAIKKVLSNNLKDFIFENYHQRMGFPKKNRFYPTKHQKKKDLRLFATALRE